MAVKLRLKRIGKKKNPVYRIVATDSRVARDGKYIDKVGVYNPLTNPPDITVDETKALKWLGHGAIPTDTVRSLFRQKGVMLRWHLMKSGMSEEQIAEELKKWEMLQLEKQKKEEALKIQAEQTKREALAKQKKEETEAPVEEKVVAETTAKPDTERAPEAKIEEPSVEVKGEAASEEVKVEEPLAEIKADVPSEEVKGEAVSEEVKVEEPLAEIKAEEPLEEPKAEDSKVSGE